MKKSSRARYSQEFRQQAVELVLAEGVSIAEAARYLLLSPKTLASWIKTYRSDAQVLSDAVRVGETDAELSRLRLENALLRRKCDILKKAAILLAKGSL